MQPNTQNQGIHSRLSIILPVYKNQQSALKTIEALLRITGSHRQIIVIDSSPEAVNSNLLKTPGVLYEHSHSRLFAGAARNLGASLATREWLYFLDSDCLPHPDFFERLEQELQSHPEALAFNGLVYYESPKASADFFLHILEFHEYSSLRIRNPRFLHSGNLVIQKQIYKEARGFRTDIPMCTDFSFFAQMPQDALKRCYYIPKLSITHQAHYVDPNKINEKLKQMGYWRGFVESQIPSSMQISHKLIFKLMPSLLAASFMAMILYRSFRFKSIYRFETIRGYGNILGLCHIWAQGFWQGTKNGKATIDPREERRVEASKSDSWKNQLRQYAPVWVLKLGSSAAKFIVLFTIKRLVSDSQGPDFLKQEDLLNLYNSYQGSRFARNDYKMDSESMYRRAEDRRDKIKKKLGHGYHAIASSLELGCGDGLTSQILSLEGISAVATDLLPTTEKFSITNPCFRQMNAENLEFPDSSFDLVFSFNAFEHFQQPRKILSETCRVLKPCGFLYLDFGPLYMSSKGLHAYTSIPIPYLQFLWAQNTIESFVEENELRKIDFEFVNQWSVRQYRDLWAVFSDKFQILSYLELPDLGGVSLIKKYPSCFRKAGDLENLVVSFIEVVFQKN